MNKEWKNNEVNQDDFLAYHLHQLNPDDEVQMRELINTQPEFRKQSDSLENLLSKLDSYNVDVPETLLGKIETAVRKETPTVESLLQKHSRIFGEQGSANRRLSFRQFFDYLVTAAAIVLISTAVLLTTRSHRGSDSSGFSTADLGMIGSASGLYSNDFGAFWNNPAHRDIRQNGNYVILRKYPAICNDSVFCPLETRKSLERGEYTKVNVAQPSYVIVPFKFTYPHPIIPVPRTENSFQISELPATCPSNQPPMSIKRTVRVGHWTIQIEP